MTSARMTPPVADNSRSYDDFVEVVPVPTTMNDYTVGSRTVSRYRLEPREEYLAGEAHEVAYALAVELVRRAREGERALDAYVGLLRERDTLEVDFSVRRGA